MAEPATSARSLLVFADDWGRHPSSCQHLVRMLLPRYPTWWVNTIGMRRPAFSRSTVRRGLETIRHWYAPAAQRGAEGLPENLHVVRPKMWPYFTRPHDRRINRSLLLSALEPLVSRLPQPVAAVTTIPIVAGLVGALPVSRWVYYCVDDFSSWPGLDQAPLRAMEAELAAKADVLVAASETLQARLAALGRSAELLTHGVDPDHWKGNGQSAAVMGLQGLEPPLVVFWGVVDRRMDVDFIARLGSDLEQGTILLVGPRDDPDPALLRLPRVAWLPPLRYAQLPALAAQAAVLIMPYRDLPVTRAMQPLKLKEYLASGRPTVARALPSVAPWADCLDLADSAAEFSAAVRRRIAGDDPARLRLVEERLRRETWEEKARQFERIAL